MNIQNLKKYISVRLRSFGKTNTQIFDDVYMNHRWGTNPDDKSSSGKGSFAENSVPYEDFIVEYIMQHEIRSIVDIGCGDFQVSGRILERLPDHINYIGLDVSNVVISRNTSMYANDRIRFQQVDVVEEDIPASDLVVVREVLQHLPNDAVKRVIDKLVRVAGSTHVIITNTVSTDPEVVNMDIPAGAASRAGFKSGLWLDKSPFGYNVDELLRVKHKHHPTEIITVRLKQASDD